MPGISRFSTLAAATLLIGFSLPSQIARADSLTLFNTGVDASGNPLADGAIDTHYAINAGSGPYAIGDATVAAFAWVGNTPTSRWISSSANGGEPDTTFSTTFDLTNLNPATASISGSVAADNGTQIYLNGNLILDDSFNGSNAPWTVFVPFSASSGFVAGINTLTFVTPNGGGNDGPGGLQVNNLVGSASSASVPEPGSIALLAGMGLTTGGVLARRKRALNQTGDGKPGVCRREQNAMQDWPR